MFVYFFSSMLMAMIMNVVAIVVVRPQTKVVPWPDWASVVVNNGWSWGWWWLGNVDVSRSRGWSGKIHWRSWSWSLFDYVDPSQIEGIFTIVIDVGIALLELFNLFKWRSMIEKTYVAISNSKAKSSENNKASLHFVNEKSRKNDFTGLDPRFLNSRLVH